MNLPGTCSAGALASLIAMAAVSMPAIAQQQPQKPNILVIRGDRSSERLPAEHAT